MLQLHKMKIDHMTMSWHCNSLAHFLRFYYSVSKLSMPIFL